MNKLKLKWYWHIHHGILLEPLLEPLKKRIEYIKKNKPKKQVKLRLRLLKPVRGKLPDEVIKAGETYFIIMTQYLDMWKAARKLGDKYKDWNESLEIAAYTAFQNYKAALREHAKELQALHKQECPHCPWNGKTIFSKKLNKKHEKTKQKTN
jgi:hypothetical protein